MDYNITYRQKDKGWQFIISYKDNNGKWKQRSKQGFKTKKDAKPEAESLLSDLKKEQKANTKANYKDITLEELSDAFIKHITLYREQGTLMTTKRGIRMFKSIFDKKVIEIKKGDIQAIMDECVSRGVREVTLKNYLTFLNQALNYYKEFYNSNYELPTNKLLLPKSDKKEKKALTRSELEELLKYFKNNRPNHEYVICLIAGTCGLRYGEIMGLTWKDIDETNQLLSVNKQWKVNKEGKWDFGKLKTKNSTRFVPISPKTFNVLTEFKKNSITDMKNRIIAMNATTCRINLHYALKKSFNVSIHELRHTYTTLLIQNGFDFKTAAEYIGDNVQEVIRTYSHVNDDMRKRGNEKISEIF